MVFLVAIWKDRTREPEIKLMSRRRFRKDSPTKLVSEKLAKCVSIRRVKSMDGIYDEDSDVLIEGIKSSDDKNDSFIIPINDTNTLRVPVDLDERTLGEEVLV